MIVSLVAAMGKDRILGKAEGGIPWDLPRDRVHFRAYTAGKWLLVGRRTYGEMDGWFADRNPIVLTRSPQCLSRPRGHRVASSVPAAIALAEKEGAKELVVCGGAEVYASALPHAQRLLLTLVDCQCPEAPGTPSFPEWQDQGQWQLLARESWLADAQNPHAATLLLLARRELANRSISP